MPNPLLTYISNIYDLVWFDFRAYQPLKVIQCQILFWHIYQIYMIWFGLILGHINHWRLFNAKSSFDIYIKYIWFGLVWFYGISTIEGYSMPNPLLTYISNIYDLVWFDFMTYQPLKVIQCQILFWHIYQIYMIWFGLILGHINHWRLFNAKSSFDIYIKYIWFGLVWF